MCAELRHCKKWVTNRERQRVPQWRTCRDGKTSLSVSRRSCSRYRQIAACCRSEMTSARPLTLDLVTPWSLSFYVLVPWISYVTLQENRFIRLYNTVFTRSVTDERTAIKHYVSGQCRLVDTLKLTGRFGIDPVNPFKCKAYQCDHITPLLRQLHWLKVPWWIDIIADRPDLQMSSWPGTVIPRWRTSPSSRVGVSKASAFASSHELSVPWRIDIIAVPRTRLSTYGNRALPVAAARIWNSLPQHITSAPSLPVFCCRLKTYFFELCYP